MGEVDQAALLEVLILKLRDLMTPNVRTCSPDSSLSDVAKIMAEINSGFVPVSDGTRVVGVITDRDIVLRGVAKGIDLKGTPAKECMTTPAFTGSPEMDAHEAANLMADKQIRRLAICENDKLVGVVSLGDLATVSIHVNEAGQALSNISEPSQPRTH